MTGGLPGEQPQRSDEGSSHSLGNQNKQPNSWREALTNKYINRQTDRQSSQKEHLVSLLYLEKESLET